MAVGVGEAVLLGVAVGVWVGVVVGVFVAVGMGEDVLVGAAAGARVSVGPGVQEAVAATRGAAIRESLGEETPVGVESGVGGADVRTPQDTINVTTTIDTTLTVAIGRARISIQAFLRKSGVIIVRIIHLYQSLALRTTETGSGNRPDSIHRHPSTPHHPCQNLEPSC